MNCFGSSVPSLSVLSLSRRQMNHGIFQSESVCVCVHVFYLYMDLLYQPRQLLRSHFAESVASIATNCHNWFIPCPRIVYVNDLITLFLFLSFHLHIQFRFVVIAVMSGSSDDSDLFHRIEK